MASHSTSLPLHVLHLEDSAADHELARLTLRRAGLGHTLVRVDTLEGFQDSLRDESFDVILADYNLPGFTALDAWALISGLSAKPPFILLSGAIGEAAAVDAMRLGIADYVLKDEIARLPHVIERAREVHEARITREHAVQELAHSQQRLAELTEHLQSSIEQERAAISREIHDDIGGSLTAILFDLAWIGRHAKQTEVCDHAHAATSMLQHALGASQRIMMNLRPPILDQGLVAAVQWLASGFERRSGVATQVRSNATVIHLSPEVQLVAYRTAQEALTNASKYAQAQTIHIDMADTGGVFTLEISDDGRGLDDGALSKPKSFGLTGLRERAKTVDGWLDISSRSGHGTSIILSVPLSLPSERANTP